MVVDTLNKISKYKNGLNGIIKAHDAFIGKNVTIYQQVTIPYKECGVPNIGSNVEIGAGAKLLGKIIIGNNTKISANAVVLQNIPDDCLAVGIPAVIKRVYSKWWLKIFLYKNYINDTMIAFPAIELEVCKIRISQLFQIIVGVDKCIEVMAYRILHRQ